MNGRTTLALLLLALALGLYILGVDRGRDDSGQRADKARRAVAFLPAQVTHLELQGGAVRISATRTPGGWRMTAPIQAEADETRVDGLLERLAELPRSQLLTEAQIRRRGLTDADYGLDAPRWTIRLGTRERERVLLIGRDAPSGDALYVRLDGAREVVVAPTNLLAELPVSVDDYRNRHLAPGTPGDIARFSLRSRAGYVEVLRKETGEWELVKPVAARADAGAVAAALRAVHAARIVDFEPASRVGASLYGLDEPVLRCTLAARDGSPERALLIGKPVGSNTNLVYAARDEIAEVYTVDRTLLSSLLLAPDDLRDRSLLPVPATAIGGIRLAAGESVIDLIRTGDTWRVAAPQSMPADARKVQLALAEWSGAQVRSFIDLPTTNAARTAGTGTGVLRTVTFQLASPAASAAATSLVFEVLSTNDPLPLLRAATDPDTRLRVDPGTLGALPQDVLYFRDPAIHLLFTNAIRSIVLTRGEEAVTLTPGATNAAPDARVEPLLHALADLRARSFVTTDTRDLLRFGLAEPYATLVLVAGGEAGPARALRIGAVAPGGGRYAMTQAEELVFVLDAVTVTRLLEALEKPAP